MTKSPHLSTGPGIGPSEILMTRRQTAERLQVSIMTLRRWEKRGILHGRTIGGKLVRYSASEIEGIIMGI